jgi:hypothetical protein
LMPFVGEGRQRGLTLAPRPPPIPT